MKTPYTKSGKCGNLVWQRARYGQICYPYFIPANPRTPAQRAVRGQFGAVSARWRTLTEEQRLSWCVAGKTKKTRRRLGRCWPLPGFNYFVKVNVALVHRGQAQVDQPPWDTPQPGADASILWPGLCPQAQPPLAVPPEAPPGLASRAPPPSG
jgi:hypothetical protein